MGNARQQSSQEIPVQIKKFYLSLKKAFFRKFIILFRRKRFHLSLRENAFLPKTQTFFNENFPSILLPSIFRNF